MGGWTKIVGFLGLPPTVVEARARRAPNTKPSAGISRLSILTYAVLTVAFFALIAYLRYRGSYGHHAKLSLS